MSDARRVATLGIGFGALAVASLGFLGQVVEPPVVEPVQQVQKSAASGGGDGGGRGWVYKDHAWVRLTKVARVGTRTHDFTVDVSTSSDLRGSLLTSRAEALTTGTSAATLLNTTRAHSTSQVPQTAVTGFETLRTATTRASVKSPTCETLELAELLAALDLV